MASPVALIVMTIGAIASVGGSVMTWVQTGDRARHSYDVFELVGRLGFAPNGVEAQALRWWPTMPLIVIAAVVASLWGLRRTGALIGVLGGAYAGGVGTVVETASTTRDVEVRAGALVTAIGGWALVAGSLVALAAALHSRRVPASTGGS